MLRRCVVHGKLMPSGSMARHLTLASRSIQPGTASSEKPPLVVFHGLLGSSSNFSSVGKKLAERLRRQVVLADLRNHGGSPWHDSMAFDDMSLDAVQLIKSIGGVAHLCGHSLGGKVAMATALKHPEFIRSCTVVDISPVAYSTSEKQWIQIQDIVKKAAASDPSSLQDRKEGYAMLAPEVPEAMRPFVLQNLIPSTEPGSSGYKWRCNIQVLAKQLDQMAWFWAHPPEGKCTTVPTRFIAGSESSYIGSKTRKSIDSFFKRARVDVIEGAGHWVHADKPSEFIDSVVRAVEDAEAA